MNAFWAVPAETLLERLGSVPRGLSMEEARRRLDRSRGSRLQGRRKASTLLLLLLLLAACLSLFLRETMDAVIVLAIVLASGLLGFWQEHGAARAVEKLLAIVQIKAEVLRDGTSQEIPVEDIVPGDLVVLSAGNVVPGDGLILESKDLFLDEAALTGETYPVEKTAQVLPAETPLSQRTNT